MEELNSNPIEEGTKPKIIDTIVDEVLDVRSGYIKGLGYGPKPTTKVSNAKVVELEASLMNLKFFGLKNSIFLSIYKKLIIF